MSEHQRLIEETIHRIEERRRSYGSVLVKTAIMKHEGVWKNVVTKILPLHHSDKSYVPKEKFVYRNFAVLEDAFSLDNFEEMIRNLPEKVGSEEARSTIMIRDLQVQIEGERLYDGYEYDSGTEYLDVGWYFERYHYRGRSPPYHPRPLVSADLPLFPDVNTAIDALLSIDLSRYSDHYGVLICLPRYGARVEEVNIGSKEVRVKIQSRDEKIGNIVGKLYCQRGEKVTQEDIEFTHETGNALIGFQPESFHLALISKISGEILDTRRFYSGWELPKGVVTDIPGYEMRELVRRGETESVEFKEDIGKTEEFAETVVAFANGGGGIILLGVDDHANVVGLAERDYEATVTNILRSHCDPPVRYSLEKMLLDERDIVVLRVEEGRDKPYTVKDRGPYVRANATDRIATRYELDEFYRQKQSAYR